MRIMLWGALATSCWVAGLFFLRFWRRLGDRLFLFFCLGFWALGANWLGLALLAPATENQHFIYLLRLCAFLLIITGIVDKNRRERKPRHPSE